MCIEFHCKQNAFFFYITLGGKDFDWLLMMPNLSRRTVGEPLTSPQQDQKLEDLAF